MMPIRRHAAPFIIAALIAAALICLPPAARAQQPPANATATATTKTQPPAAPAVNAQTKDEAPIGTIAEIEGLVAMAQGDKAVEVEIGQLLYPYDILETGPASRAAIVFIDDTELTLGENARLTIDEYVFDPENPDVNKGSFSILRGPFVFISGLIGKKPKPDVTVTTEFGSIGIRGTEFWGGSLDDEYNVFVRNGEVNFATDRGRVTVRAGEGTRVANRRNIPARAQKWGQTKIDRADNAVGLKNATAVKARIATMKQQHTAMRDLHREAIYGRIKLRKEEIERKRLEMQQDRRDNLREHRPDNPPGGGKSGQKTGDDTGKKPGGLMTEKSENRPDQQTGPQSAPEFEQREKSHLQNKPPAANNNPPPARRSPPPARR